MNLKIQSIDRTGVIHVAAEGDMVGAGLPDDGGQLLSQLVGENWSGNRVVLNLENATFIDSTAIGWLLNTVKQFKESGGGFALHSVPSNIRQLFDMLKINTVLPIAKDGQQALEKVNGV
ncbi:MAG: STAS domain-containing protein [Phycisphaeraceae bacterium]|nr:STAS domain-containing protein [Phycisphaeraceae bacterium]